MVFITKSGKELQVPNDYTYMSLEKFATEIYQQGRADAIEEYKNKCIDEINKLVGFWKKDKTNRPRPTIDSAVVILTLWAEQLKEQSNE